MTTNALAVDFQKYLESCSQEVASQIIGVLQQAATRTVARAASDMVAVDSTIAKITKKQRKKARSDTVASGSKRPLNSWMAFRKYYTAMLAPHTQKAISSALTIFWRADHFQAKWAILAKAYSIVRGCREKKDAPLDEFFAHCAALIGVIPPNEYLQRMGWQFGPPLGGNQMPSISRLFVPGPESFPTKFTTTTLSVNDLVKHCYSVGFASANNNGPSNASVQDSLTMVSIPTAIMPNYMGEVTRTTPFAQMNTTLAFNVATSEHYPHEGFRQILSGDLADFAPSTTYYAEAPLLVATAPAGKSTLDQAVEALELSGVEYPYSALFDPASQFDVSFDPVAPNTAVEDDGRWDAFDPSMLMAQSERNETSASIDEMLNVRWEDFVNENGMA